MVHRSWLLHRQLFLLLAIVCATLPAPPARTEIGIYSGTFDPVHLGHLETAISAANRGQLSRVVVFPNLDPGDKPYAQPFDTRYELLQAAVADNPLFVLPPKDVLKSLLSEPDPVAAVGRWTRERFPDAQRLNQIVGADSLAKLVRKPAVVARIQREGTQLIVEERAGFEKPKVPAALKDNVQWIPATKILDASSSRYRENPLLWEAILPRAVAQKIRERGLYGRGQERGFYQLPGPLSTLLEHEQIQNDRIEDTSVFSQIGGSGTKVPAQYMPEARPTFYLYTVEIPFDEMASVITAGEIPDQLLVSRAGKKYVKFLIHPESKKFFEKKLKDYPWKKEFVATPTSSHRSLIVWDPHSDREPLYVKVTLDKDIGGSRRLLTSKQIERAAAASACLQTIDPADLERRGMVFMDEPVSLYPKAHPFGMTIRTLPKPAEGAEFVPMFSLYSRLPGGGEPPILGMIRKSGLTPRQFARKFLIDPVLEHMAYLAFEHGMVGEPHEQNVLIEIKDGLPTGRFVHRDLAGFTLSPELRAARGKDMSFLPPGIDLQSLKSERAVFPERMDTYFRHANLYALEVALQEAFPELNAEALDKEFAQGMKRVIEKYSGKRVLKGDFDKTIERYVKTGTRRCELQRLVGRPAPNIQPSAP